MKRRNLLSRVACPLKDQHVSISCEAQLSLAVRDLLEWTLRLLLHAELFGHAIGLGNDLFSGLCKLAPIHAGPGGSYIHVVRHLLWKQLGSLVKPQNDQSCSHVKCHINLSLPSSRFESNV